MVSALILTLHICVWSKTGNGSWLIKPVDHSGLRCCLPCMSLCCPVMECWPVQDVLPSPSETPAPLHPVNQGRQTHFYFGLYQDLECFQGPVVRVCIDKTYKKKTVKILTTSFDKYFLQLNNIEHLFTLIRPCRTSWLFLWFFKKNSKSLIPWSHWK